MPLSPHSVLCLSRAVRLYIVDATSQRAHVHAPCQHQTTQPVLTTAVMTGAMRRCWVYPDDPRSVASVGVSECRQCWPSPRILVDGFPACHKHTRTHRHQHTSPKHKHTVRVLEVIFASGMRIPISNFPHGNPMGMEITKQVLLS